MAGRGGLTESTLVENTVISQENGVRGEFCRQTKERAAPTRSRTSWEVRKTDLPLNRGIGFGTADANLAVCRRVFAILANMRKMPQAAAMFI